MFGCQIRSLTALLESLLCALVLGAVAAIEEAEKDDGADPNGQHLFTNLNGLDNNADFRTLVSRAVLAPPAESVDAHEDDLHDHWHTDTATAHNQVDNGNDDIESRADTQQGDDDEYYPHAKAEIESELPMISDVVLAVQSPGWHNRWALLGLLSKRYIGQYGKSIGTIDGKAWIFFPGNTVLTLEVTLQPSVENSESDGDGERDNTEHNTDNLDIFVDCLLNLLLAHLFE